MGEAAQGARVSAGVMAKLAELLEGLPDLKRLIAIFRSESKAVAVGEEAAAVAKSAAPAGAVEIRMTAQEYEAALRHVFPSHALNRTASMIDGIAANAAQTVSKDPRFLSAWATNDMKTAGNIFHSFAAQEARTIPPSAVADGWTLTAERTIKSGKGGSRADIFLEGPDKEIIEIDWKTTGTSALASKSQMAKHAGHIRVELGGKLTVQESRSWVDYVRPLLP